MMPTMTITETTLQQNGEEDTDEGEDKQQKFQDDNDVIEHVEEVQLTQTNVLHGYLPDRRMGVTQKSLLGPTTMSQTDVYQRISTTTMAVDPHFITMWQTDLILC